MGWVLIGIGIAIFFVIIVFVFLLGTLIGAFVLTKFLYDAVGEEYTFRQFLKDTFGPWRKDN